MAHCRASNKSRLHLQALDKSHLLCYIYVTTPFRKRDDGQIAYPNGWDPSLWSPAFGWTDEPLPPKDKSAWSQFFSGVAIALVVVCGAVIVIAVIGFVALVMAVHQLDNFHLNLSGVPNPSSAPSAYGLNAVVSQNRKSIFVTEPARIA